LIASSAALAATAWEFADASIERHLLPLSGTEAAKHSARLRTLLPMLRTVFLELILVVLGLTALSKVGVHVAPLLAGAGILDLAISLGSQRLVQDVATRFFPLIENALHAGDSVTLAGISGTVERLTIRTLWVRAGERQRHHRPVQLVSTLSNARGGAAVAILSVTVAYHENIDRIGEALLRVAEEVSADPQVSGMIRGDFQFLGIDKVGPSGVTASGQVACTPDGKGAVQRAFNRRLKERFVALGIGVV
jgi:moderate conductance mechanosensitive channel